MWDSWRFLGDHGEVLITRGAHQDGKAARRLSPERAAWEVDRWFLAGSDATSARALLADIGQAVGMLSPTDPRTATHSLKEALTLALREGRLMAYTLEVKYSGGSVPKPIEPPPEPDPKKTEEKTWVGVELLYKSDGKPVAGARYRLKLPDGSTRSGSLNGKGEARIDGIDAGDCAIDFPDFAPKEWGATPAQGGGFDYTVTKGDCLSSIAKKFGFADWRTIYDADENAAFRERRKDPNLIFPGDKLHIPGKQPEPLERPTGAKHSFRLIASKARFKVRILFGVPFTYKLEIEGTPHEGTLDDGAVIDVPIEPDARSGKLWLWPNSDMEADPLEWTLDLGALDPIDEASGVQARLNNLGFRCGKADGIVGPKTERALRAFQEVANLSITGAIDDATRDAIRSRHDVQ